MRIVLILAFAVLSQGLGAVNGLLLSHWLSVQDYALYTIMGIMGGAVIIMTKGGIHLGLNAILGQTWPDRVRAAQATRAALEQRKRISIFLLPPLLVVAGFLLYRNHASTGIVVAMLAMLVAIWLFDMQSRVVDQVLLFANRGRAVQALDAGLSGGRLVMSCLVFVAGMQSAVAAILVNVAVAAARVPFIQRWTRSEMQSTDATVEADRELICSIMRRQIPMDAFFCLQSQLALAIVAYYGSVSQTAAIGALSRVGQLLLPVAALVATYVVPRFAKAKTGVLRRYFGLVLLASLPAGCLIAFSIMLPDVLLLLIGDHYAHLQSEVVIACVGAGAYSVAGIAWELLANRGLNHFTFMQVPAVLAWCLIAPYLIDLSSLRGVLWFEVGQSCGLAVAAVCELIGAIYWGRLSSPMEAPGIPNTGTP